LLELDQSTAQFQLGHHLAREATQRFGLLKGKLPGLEIHDTQCSQRKALDGDERHATIELKIWLSRDEGDFAEPRVLPQIGGDYHLGPADRSRTKGDLARALVEIRWQTVLGLEPEPIIVHQADIGDWTLANFRGQFPDFVIGKFGGCIEDIESTNDGKPLCFVGRYWKPHREEFIYLLAEVRALRNDKYRGLRPIVHFEFEFSSGRHRRKEECVWRPVERFPKQQRR
jgi:hypothetical protein